MKCSCFWQCFAFCDFTPTQNSRLLEFIQKVHYVLKVQCFWFLSHSILSGVTFRFPHTFYSPFPEDRRTLARPRVPLRWRTTRRAAIQCDWEVVESRELVVLRCYHNLMYECKLPDEPSIVHTAILWHSSTASTGTSSAVMNRLTGPSPMRCEMSTALMRTL